MTHQPDYLRQAFLEYLDNEYQETDDLGVKVDVGDDYMTAHALMGNLWFCTDIVPDVYCDLVDMPRGSTYAQVVRTIRPELEGYTIRYRKSSKPSGDRGSYANDSRD